MRLQPEIIHFLKKAATDYFDDNPLYLFGSRINDHAKGGDIDLFVLSEEKIPLSVIRKFKVDFYLNFGWQKIDLINFTYNEESTFKTIASNNAMLINDIISD